MEQSFGGVRLTNFIGDYLKTIVTPAARALEHTTCLFIWESLAEVLAGVRRVAPTPLPPHTRWHPTSANLFTSPLDAATNHEATTNTFLWTPPDLTPGKKWYNQQVHNLHLVAQHYPGREARLIHEELESLVVHRNNYDATGAVLKKLQLLWWQPCEMVARRVFYLSHRPVSTPILTWMPSNSRWRPISSTSL